MVTGGSLRAPRTRGPCRGTPAWLGITSLGSPFPPRTPGPSRALAPEEDLGLTKWRDRSAELAEELRGEETPDTQNTERSLRAAEFTAEAAGGAGRRRGWFWCRDAAAVPPRPLSRLGTAGPRGGTPPAPRHPRASGPSLAVPASVSLQSAVGVLGGVLGKARLIRQRVVRKH